MWWAIVTLGTVGYGDVVPATPLGKLVSVFAIVVGFAMIALPVAIISTAFADEVRRRDFVVTWGMLARVPLFSHLSAAEIADIMRLLKARTIEANEILVRRGDAASSMYFITTGEVEIELPTQRVRLADGTFFGEIALLHRTKRSGTVTATRQTRLLVLDAQQAPSSLPPCVLIRCTVVTWVSTPLPRRETTSSLSQGMSAALAPGELPTTLPTTALPSPYSQPGPAKCRPTVLPSAIRVAIGSRKAQASRPSAPALHS